ncbi:MAG: response regulator [Anaerolineae bacterium]|nr:response regulator [Anaerolineae bacterium]
MTLLDASDPKNVHILLIEDNIQNSVLIGRLLESIGVQNYSCIFSGRDLLEATRTMPRLDLILLDLHLPFEDGFEVLSKIRSTPRIANSLVVAVTADAHLGTMKRARKAGFDGFLGKPIDPDLFPKHIITILHGQMVWHLG